MRARTADAARLWPPRHGAIEGPARAGPPFRARPRPGKGTGLAGLAAVPTKPLSPPPPHAAPLSLLAVLVGIGGCYATQSVAPDALGELRQGNRARELVLRSGERHRVRIGPGSWIRFQRVDGLFTSWVEARALRVGPDQVVLGGGDPDDGLVLRWNDLVTVEVNDVDTGRTVVGIAAGTSLVVLAAAAEVMVIAALEAATGGHLQGDLGLTRGALEAVLERAGERPEDDPEALTHGDEASGAEPVVRVSPLFAAEARRRDIVRFGASVETGIEVGGGSMQSEATLNVGLRLLNVLELGAGLSTLTGPLGASDAAAAPSSASGLWAASRIIPRARLGLHLDLDPGRRVALALGQQLGIGTHGWIDLRTEWGVRVRLNDRLQLGVYPLNPRIGWQSQTASRTTYVSAIELAWLM
jgi:hypothetical protein